MLLALLCAPASSSGQLTDLAVPCTGLDDLEMQLNYEFRRSKAVQAMQQQYNERLLSNLHGNAAYLR